MVEKVASKLMLGASVGILIFAVAKNVTAKDSVSEELLRLKRQETTDASIKHYLDLTDEIRERREYEVNQVIDESNKTRMELDIQHRLDDLR